MNTKIKRKYLLLWILVLGLLLSKAESLNADEFVSRRLEMVKTQIEKRGIRDKKTLQSMLIIPRHKFVPKRYISMAYADRPLPIGEGQTISQPYIVALMTEKLDLKPTDRVLEIGTGSGYQAAVLSKICKEVYTIEIIPPLGKRAKQLLENLGYTNIKKKVADGYYGWEKYAPFDAIIVTAAATHIPPPLIKQLKVGGRMVTPIGGVFQVQRLMFIRKNSDGTLISESICPVRFVPLTGATETQ